jgi:hypothetical protein
MSSTKEHPELVRLNQYTQFSVAAHGPAGKLLATVHTHDGPLTRTLTTISSTRTAFRAAGRLETIAEHSVHHRRLTAWRTGGDVSTVRRDILAVYADGTTGRPRPETGPMAKLADRVHHLGNLLAAETGPVRSAVADAIGELFTGPDLLVPVKVTDQYKTVRPVSVDINDWLQEADDDEIIALTAGDTEDLPEWLVDVFDDVEPVRQAARTGTNGWELDVCQPALTRWIGRFRPHLTGMTRPA